MVGVFFISYTYQSSPGAGVLCIWRSGIALGVVVEKKPLAAPRGEMAFPSPLQCTKPMKSQQAKGGIWGLFPPIFSCSRTGNHPA
jgi:hypothetical protein